MAFPFVFYSAGRLIIMDLQRIFTEAVTLHSQGKFPEAKIEYERILQELPDNINVLGNIGLVCREMGDFEEALKYCSRALSKDSTDPAQHINLGAVHEAMNNLVEAEQSYKNSLAIAPYHPMALNNLGKVYHLQGNGKKAIECLEKALAIEPEYGMALNNLAVILSEIGEVEAAREKLEKSYSLEPNNPDTLFNLAGIYNCQDLPEKAEALLKELIEKIPDHQPAVHMLSALQGQTTDSAPAAYVRETFDRYAGRFDDHLLNKLGYSVPAALAEMLCQDEGETHFSHALDIGCGTGLSGQPFKAVTDDMTGVDLSRQMLDKAETKGIYTRLICQGIYQFLESDPVQYDLIIAADVFIYLGRLDTFFTSIARVAGRECTLVCSIESYDGEDYVLRKSGRYAHNPSHLVAIAEKNGFHLLQQKAHGIRKEDGVWIPGELLILKKTVK